MPESQTEQMISEQPEGPAEAIGAPHEEKTGSKLWLAGLTALGVVYGDIGTSPLYALRECFRGEHPIPATHANVLGVLSLIFWALIIVISIKYLVYVMKADNRGEGGILALMALLDPWGATSKRRERKLLLLLGVFGAALLYGDGMITPAISVLSAVEGLKVATPVFEPYIIPVTIVILIFLFALQRRGTAGIGKLFGPVMLVWFGTLIVLGVTEIVKNPHVLASVNPYHGVRFFLDNRFRGFEVLGAVFLVVTGGEALYSDMGHFGGRPIRLAWFSMVLPSLLLNYMGQGALLLNNAGEITQPFYHLAPRWALYPLVALATIATVIASQAVISGAFSLTRQAVLLGELPRIRIVQTSSEEIGQIYIPGVNWVLMLATVALVLGFRTSSNLAAAYGVAVTTTMVITTLLAFTVTRELWHWRLSTSLLVTGALLVVDVSFFGANMLKIIDGGWFPLLIGALVYTLMSTWRRGRAILGKRLASITTPFTDFMERIKENPPLRVPGTAVFMATRSSGTPPMLLHHLKHNQALHEQVILLTVVTEEVPVVRISERVEVEKLEMGFFRVIVHYGFLDNPNVPSALRLCKRFGLEVDPHGVTYYVGRHTPIPVGEGQGMTLWREKLFAYMSRNAALPITFYRIPAENVIELGLQVELQSPPGLEA